LKIGDNGYYFVVDASPGASRGTLVVHPDAAGQRADDTRAPYAQMLAAGQGQFAHTSLDPAAHDAQPTAKFVSFTTIPQWQWLVGGIALDDELLAGMRTLRNRFLMIAAVLVAAFAGLFVLVVRRVVSRPLDAAARASERYAAGASVRIRDGATARGVAGNDEIGRLVQAVDGIGDGLARIVAQVRGSARTSRAGRSASRPAAATSPRGSRRRRAASSKRPRAWSRSRPPCSRTPSTRRRPMRWWHGVGGGHRRRRGRAARGRDDGRHRPHDAPDRRNHDHDRRHRVPDQHPRAERGGRGRAGRRARPGLRGGRGEVRALAQRSAAAVKEIEGLSAESATTVEQGYRIADARAARCATSSSASSRSAR
jgi:methyl-accepting chemotaxis protein-2 (aspartate sensor receptor)